MVCTFCLRMRHDGLMIIGRVHLSKGYLHVLNANYVLKCFCPVDGKLGAFACLVE